MAADYRKSKGRFIFHNENPRGLLRASDCVIRAIAKATKREWERYVSREFLQHKFGKQGYQVRWSTSGWQLLARTPQRYVKQTAMAMLAQNIKIWAEKHKEEIEAWQNQS